MDAVTPTPIKLEDLTRDELLQLVLQVAPFLRPRDLWRARWEVACAKSDAASQASVEASKHRAAAAKAWEAARAGTRACARAEAAYFKARAEYVAAQQKADRTYAAQERLWRAYDACKL